MDWFEGLSFRKKLLIGCYSLVGLFSVVLLIWSFTSSIPLPVGILAVIVLIGVSYPIINVLGRALTSPIESMSRIALNISKGDFSQKVHIDSNDALGELGESFNKMIDKLKEILNETTSITKHVSDSSRDIYTKNKNLVDVIGQVTTSTNELAIGANNISEDVSNISVSVKDIENKVAYYAGSTKEMNRRSDETLRLMENGKSAVESQGHGMKSNVEATAAVAGTINNLAKQAQHISKITKTISEIADQTSLLSLNASIEAARAGEHGRGFAVVAQEVRNLAEESTASTKEVFSVVRSIEQGIQQAIRNINENEKIVEEQTKLIEQTEAVFQQMVESIQYISEEMDSFAKQSDQMLDSAKNISMAIENISAITEQSAAGTEEVSAAMNEQISSIQEMVQQSEDMANVVSKLQRTIHIFKF